ITISDSATACSAACIRRGAAVRASTPRAPDANASAAPAASTTSTSAGTSISGSVPSQSITSALTMRKRVGSASVRSRSSNAPRIVRSPERTSGALLTTTTRNASGAWLATAFEVKAKCARIGKQYRKPVVSCQQPVVSGCWMNAGNYLLSYPPLKIRETSLPGLLVIEPKVFGDDRGFFMETYRADTFRNAGIGDAF